MVFGFERHIEAEKCAHPVQSARVVNEAAQHHDEEKGERGPATEPLQDARPFRRAVLRAERVEDERFVRAAGGRLGRAAQHAINQEGDKYDGGISERYERQQRHLENHEARRAD